MAQEYNIAPWFSPKYKTLMEIALGNISRTFDLEMCAANVFRFAYLNDVDGLPYQKEVNSTEIVWFGNQFNIGYHALLHSPPNIYRYLFPSCAIASIEVYVAGPSAAESDVIPEELAKSLSPAHAGVERLRDVRGAFSLSERLVVRDVLEILALRNDECGSIAADALADFWSDSVGGPK